MTFKSFQSLWMIHDDRMDHFSFWIHAKNTVCSSFTAPEPTWNQNELHLLITVGVWGTVTHTGKWESWIRDPTSSVYTVLSSLHFSLLLTSTCSVSLCSSSVWSHPSPLIHRVGINPCVITWRGSMWSQVGRVLDAPGLSSKWHQERMGEWMDEHVDG